MNWESYSDDPTPEQHQQAVFAQRLQNQHAMALDNLVGSYMLWNPELVYPLVEAAGVLHTILQLNDGRLCNVITCSMTGKTEIFWKGPN